MSIPIEFKLSGPYIELSQILKASHVCSSGGEAKVLITEGLVKVDGAVENRKGCKIRVGQQVEVNDQVILVK